MPEKLIHKINAKKEDDINDYDFELDAISQNNDN